MGWFGTCFGMVWGVSTVPFSAVMKVDIPGKKYLQTVERLVDWGLTSHQQLRSYDGTSFIEH